MDNIIRKRDLFEAFKSGGLEKTRVLINSNGLSHSPDWSEGYVLLVEALKREDVACAKLLLINGSRVNPIKQEPYDTPLNIAIQKNYIEIVKMLLDMGAEIYPKNDFDTTPLHFDVFGNYSSDMVNILIDKGVEIDAKNYRGETPLHRAIRFRNMEAIKLFLHHGADVNAIDNDGRSPIHHAVDSGCFQFVEHLLNCGAYVNCIVKGWKSYTPLHLALEKGEEKIFKFLISKDADVNIKGEDGITCLHIAARKGHASIVENLLNHGACIDPLTLSKNYTPLHIALRESNTKVSKLLISKGANVNAADYNGLTVLHIACRKGHTRLVEMLLEYGANIDCKDKYEATPLHLCATYDSNETTETMLKLGADINSRDSNGRTALHIACKNGCVEVVRILLHYGADMFIRKHSEQHTPLDCALSIMPDHLLACNSGVNDYDYNARYSFRYDPNRRERIVVALKLQMIKLQTAKLCVSGKNITGIEGCAFFQDECKEEISRMKSEKIYRKITLFDILAASSLDSYMRNIHVERVLTLGNYLTKFPIYANILTNNFRKGMKRKKLLEASKTILHSLFEDKPELPYFCMEQILSYLDDNELKTLINLQPPSISCPKHLNHQTET